MARTVVAADAVGIDHAILRNPHRMADLDRRFPGEVGQADGARGAHLGALRALRTAVSALERHFGLHEGHQLARRTQHLIGTHRNTQLASRAMGVEVPQALRSGRNDGRGTVRNLLVDDHRQPAVDLLLLRPERGVGHDVRQAEEPAARSVGRRLCGVGRRSLRRGSRVRFPPPQRIGDGPLAAVFEAVHTGHATAVINFMRRRVDTRRLAVAGAELASVALRGVETRFEQRVAGEESQHRAHRTDRITIGAAAAPRKNKQHGERHDGNKQRGEALHPDVDRIEGVAVHAPGDVCQQVVAPRVDRGQQVRGDAAVGAVRREQRTDTRQHRGDEHDEHPPAQPGEGGGVREAVPVLSALPGGPRNDVLHHPQRADDRTVHAAEKKRQDHQERHDADIQGQQGGQELDFRHPAEPRVKRSGKIEEQQRRQHEEKGRGRNSDFS